MKFEISEDEVKSLAKYAAWCFVTSLILGSFYFGIASEEENRHRLAMAKLAVEQATKIETKTKGHK